MEKSFYRTANFIPEGSNIVETVWWSLSEIISFWYLSVFRVPSPPNPLFWIFYCWITVRISAGQSHSPGQSHTMTKLFARLRLKYVVNITRTKPHQDKATPWQSHSMTKIHVLRDISYAQKIFYYTIPVNTTAASHDVAQTTLILQCNYK